MVLQPWFLCQPNTYRSKPPRRDGNDETFNHLLPVRGSWRVRPSARTQPHGIRSGARFSREGASDSTASAAGTARTAGTTPRGPQAEGDGSCRSNATCGAYGTGNDHQHLPADSDSSPGYATAGSGSCSGADSSISSAACSIKSARGRYGAGAAGPDGKRTVRKYLPASRRNPERKWQLEWRRSLRLRIRLRVDAGLRGPSV